MIVKAMPVRPPPVIVPSSVLVKPKMRLHSPSTSPRTAKPMPAAIRVKKLAQKILPFDCIAWVSPRVWRLVGLQVKEGWRSAQEIVFARQAEGCSKAVRFPSIQAAQRK